jgi:hypothetical protein
VPETVDEKSNAGSSAMKKMQSIMIESLNVVFNFAFAGMSVMLASAVFCILRLRRHPHYFTRVCERQGAHTYKIAYLLAVGLRIGGALTHIQGFINGLIADGIRVLLIAQDTVTGIRNDSIVVHLVRSWEKPRRIPLTIAILAQNLFLLIDSLGIIRAERPDAIYQRHS